MKKDKKKGMGFRTGICLLMAVGLASPVLLFGAEPEIIMEQPRVQALKKSFDIVVRSIGVLDAEQSYMVSSTLKGDMGRIIDLAHDGVWVKKGEILVKLDPAPFQESIQDLQGKIKRTAAALETKKQLFEWEKNQVIKDLGIAEFKVKKAEMELEGYTNGEGPLELVKYREDMEKAHKEKEKYRRYLNDLKDLGKRGYDHPNEMRNAEQGLSILEENYNLAEEKVETYENHVYPSMVDRLTADVNQAQMELQQSKRGSVYQIDQAESALDEIQAALENHKKELENAKKKLIQTVIKAPSDGIVILYETYRDGQKRKPRVGDIVLQNEPILYLPNISTMIVKTRIREIDLHKAAIGQSCDISVEAYPDKKINGRIAFIGVLALDDDHGNQDEKFFQMTVALTPSDSDLRPGMNSLVSILSARVKNVLTLPAHTVFQDKTGFYCFSLQNGKYEKVAVKTGRKNQDLVEILSGVEENGWVSAIMPDPEKSF
ncbi:MAG: efflux RND transporter periplasmic adaptor subunit [Desulfobacterium sp.]|jgi:HlyD family secretion protein|nr:efflux RND transporter periplasmic adaptor subunit [Desulfobacterium sp.]